MSTSSKVSRKKKGDQEMLQEIVQSSQEEYVNSSSNEFVQSEIPLKSVAWKSLSLIEIDGSYAYEISLSFP